MTAWLGPPFPHVTPLERRADRDAAEPGQVGADPGSPICCPSVWAQDTGPTQEKDQVGAPHTLQLPPRSEGSTGVFIGRSLAQGSSPTWILRDQHSQEQDTLLQGHGRARSFSTEAARPGAAAGRGGLRKQAQYRLEGPCLAHMCTRVPVLSREAPPDATGRAWPARPGCQSRRRWSPCREPCPPRGPLPHSR